MSQQEDKVILPYSVIELNFLILLAYYVTQLTSSVQFRNNKLFTKIYMKKEPKTFYSSVLLYFSFLAESVRLEEGVSLIV